jgi:hypothetical protein
MEKIKYIKVEYLTDEYIMKKDTGSGYGYGSGSGYGYGSGDGSGN